MTRRRLPESVVALIDEIAVIAVILYVSLYALYREGYIGLDTILLVTVVFAVVAGGLTYRVASIQASQAKVGPESLIGALGEVVEDLAPEGKVIVEGEIWSAVSRSGERVSRGERVRVSSYKGLKLIVERVRGE